MENSIIIFIPTLNDGGAEKVAVSLSNSLASKGKKIILLTLKRNNKINHNISEKVEIIELNASRLLFCFFEFIKILISKRPKYLVSFLYASCIVSAICKILSFSNVKIIFSIHNNYDKSKTGFKSYIILYLFKFFLKFSFRIITVSKGLKKQIQNKFNIPEKKILYIYNPILKNSLNFESLKIDKSSKLFKKNNINILVLGRLTRQKNQIFIIKNLRKLQHFKKIKLFLVGTGEDLKLLKKEVLKNKLNNKVFFLGYKKNPYSLIRLCDYLIVPSLWEGFGNIVGEGLFFRKKVVSSDCEFGPREILNKGRFGYLFKVNSSNGLTNAFKKSFSHNKLLPNNIFLNQFNISYVSKKYEKLFP